jgi:hypothetical protein
MRRIKEQPPPRTGRPDVPASLERVLAQTLAKDPTQRPSTAIDLARALQAVETEQRWPRTPLVVLDASQLAEVPDVAAEVEGEATHLKSPTAFSPQQQRSSNYDAAPTHHRASTAQPQGARRTRERQGMPAAEDRDPTVRRSTPTKSQATADTNTAPEDTSATEVSSTATRSRKTTVLVAAAVVVIAVIIGTAVLLSGGTSSTSTPPTTAPVGPPPSVVIQGAPAPVVTASTIDASTIKFEWTNPNPQPGDQYYYAINAGDPKLVGTDTSVVFADPGGQTMCIAVKIFRNGLTGQAGSKCFP